jgi:hypothetical protein
MTTAFKMTVLDEKNIVCNLVPRQNVQGQNVRREKMSARTKNPEGQNIRGDKTSGDITSVGQNIHGAKHLEGQNVQRYNICLGYAFNVHSQ